MTKPKLYIFHCELEFGVGWGGEEGISRGHVLRLISRSTLQCRNSSSFFERAIPSYKLMLLGAARTTNSQSTHTVLKNVAVLIVALRKGCLGAGQAWASCHVLPPGVLLSICQTAGFLLLTERSNWPSQLRPDAKACAKAELRSSRKSQKVNMVLNVHRNHKAYEGWGEGGKGVWRWGERDIIYLLLHCHHQNGSCIKMGSDESHFNVSVGSDRQSHNRVSTNPQPFESQGQLKRYQTEVLLLTSLTPYR